MSDAIITTPYWWKDCPPTDSPDALPAKADVVVIGGGFTGTNAALTLRRGGASVVVLEATDFGRGASTRNAGHVSSGVNLGKGSSSAVRSPMERKLSSEVMAAIRQEAAESFDFIEQRLAELPRDALYKRSGRFIGAVSSAHFDGLCKKAESLSATIIPRAEQHNEIGTRRYFGGLVIPRSGQLDPARYLHGLLDINRAEGTTLCSNCPAERIEKTATGWRVYTLKGPIDCRNVLVATNGHTDTLVPWIRRRVIPAASYILVTDPLPNGMMDRLIPHRRTVADTKRLLNYFRPTPDGQRLLFGGRATLRLQDPTIVAEKLYARLLDIFPELAGTKISHAWNGTIAFTFDFLPHLGARDGVVYAMGCNGSGVAMLSFLGHRAAQKILGKSQSPFWNLSFPTVPGYRNYPWFLPLMSGYQRTRDWMDAFSARWDV